ncbi:toprim domain-containing protein [Formosa sp. A9]|uniref:toprim domain-containing protein n=1 Tax=Formosa sp. A9 TaxID=3442641 RepID=UPI003EB6B24E
MKRKINCETARGFSVLKALEKLGHFPQRTTEKEAWFLSPFRSETQASFKVSKRKNRWYDYGAGIGGNVIDLVCRISGCSVKEALRFLNEGNPLFSFQQPPVFRERETAIRIIKVQPLQHPALLQYQKSRHIDPMVARMYCKEVWYTVKGKSYFAVGLENDRGGWELRNKFFKNSSSPKYCTHLKHSSRQLIILEGMFDLLSLAMLDIELMGTSDILVINSIAFIKNIADYLCDYDRTLLYLDNDVAGDNAVRYLTNINPHVIDRRTDYKSYKDLNEYLCHVKQR